MKQNLPPPGTILFAEDTPEILETLAALLRLEGYAVDEVGDGEQALERIRRTKVPYWVLITDIKMPKMDGLALLSTIRERNYRVRHRIVVSAEPFSRETIRQISSDNDAVFMEKPVAIEELTAILHEFRREDRGDHDPRVESRSRRRKSG